MGCCPTVSLCRTLIMLLGGMGYLEQISAY